MSTLGEVFAPYVTGAQAQSDWAFHPVEAEPGRATFVGAFRDDELTCARVASGFGFLLQRTNGAAFNVGRAAMNLKLRAEQLGFDARVLQRFDAAALKKTLGLSDVVFAVALGPKGAFGAAPAAAGVLSNTVSGLELK